MTSWKAENLEERMMQRLLVTLLHSLKVESSSPQFLSQAPMTEPQHFFLKARHVLISLTSSKGRKWVYIMHVLSRRAMFLLLWQWQGLCCGAALKAPAVPLSTKLYESKQICGNCILLTCNKNNSSWYISDLYFSHFFFCCCQGDD